MQVRLNDVTISDTPRFLTDNLTDLTHSIAIPTNNPNKPYVIPLSLHGVTSSFPTRKPTPEEYESLPHFTLTSDEPEYDPHDTSYATQEDALTKMILATGDRIGASPPSRRLCSVTKTFSHALSIGTGNDAALLSLAATSSTFDDRSLSLELSRMISVLKRNSVGNQFDPDMLARNWGIDKATARRTVSTTTQRGIRTVLHPTLSRRFRTNDRQLRYRRLPIECFTDTLISKTASRRNNSYAQIFATADGWCRAYPMKLKSEAHEGLSLLFQREGVPNTMIMDGALEQVKGMFRKKCREAGVHVKQTEPHSPWSNAAEAAIRELKKGVGRQMVRSGAPKRLWDDCLEREAYVRSMTAHDIYKLGGQVPETIVSGETADISPFALFAWYDWVMFRDTSVSYPDDAMVLGRDLGPAIDIGPAMTRKVLKENGKVVYRSTVRSLTDDELADETMSHKRREFTNKVNLILGEGFKYEDFINDPELEHLGTPIYPSYDDDVDGESTQFADADDEPEPDPDTYDQYVGASVTLPIGDSMMSGKVRGRKRSLDGNVIGKANKNPILDTRTYEVEFADGQYAEVSANIIAQNMYAMCDSEGNQYLLLAGIVGHRKDDSALDRADMHIKHGSNQQLKKTTRGWKLCVEWKDGSTSWERLADLKESNPVELADYAVTQGIDTEPAFAWWVPYTLKRRNRIIAAVNNRYHRRSHKFGIEIPKTWDDCVRLDKENGNTMWQDAVRKEMSKVRVAFQLINDDESPPLTFQEIRCHLVFDVKMENFQRKARLVAGGHMTETPASITYASVVSRESVRIALTLAALNDLEVKTADIENAYLTAPVGEKIWCRLGPEFGNDAGKKALIVRALYGLKSAGASFRNHLADCMRHLGWQSCIADPDVWLKPEIRPSDGHKYYAYCLLYVDDILVVHHDSTKSLKEIDHFFKTKDGSIGEPDFYLGAKLRITTLPNGVNAWSMSSSKYIQAAVANVKEFHKQHFPNYQWAKRTSGPFPINYAPELDTTPELDAGQAAFYQSQVGVLRWCVELGRVDIITEVSELASYMVLPRQGHLEAIFHLFNYLEKKHNARIVFDPSYATVDMSAFKECDWRAFYGDVREAIPPNSPPPRGKDVDLRMFVDSDHAGDKRTRRSRTGFLIYLNMSPINWFSKKQATIETSVFGAEFVAMKQGMEALRGIRYKLRMMGVELSGPSYIYGDNMSVIHNTQRPESILKKKSNAVCYHAIREAVAMGECLTGHVSTNENPADICTKIIPGGQKRDHLVGLILYDIADHN
ncbi:Reverse transcriptase (RNA-dependent DNA polymerase) [Fragilaria crotonensis]|nr:Reverse transcriptase (RNA-dependent DNA polymerase) [Fragilaria crotonensis]